MSIVKICLILVLGMGNSSILAQNWDINLLKRINPQDPCSTFWRATTNSAIYLSIGPPVGMFITSIFEKDPSLRNRSYEIFGALLMDLALTEGLKVTVNRPRPAEKYPGEIFPYQNEQGLSFPSGHSSFAFASAASLALQFHKWYITLPAYLWATCVGYSRMYLGVHYPTDVLAGAAVGIGTAYLAHWINKKLFTPKPRRAAGG